MENRLVFDHKEIHGEDYSGLEFKAGFCAIASRFMDCKFERMKFGDYVPSFGEGFSRSEYIRCSFDGTKLKQPMGRARFVECSFRDVHLQKCNSRYFEFVDCVFTGKISQSVFWAAPLPFDIADEKKHHRKIIKSNEFCGNDFSGAELIDVGFRLGIDLRLQTLPTGERYIYAEHGLEAIDRARMVLESWEDDDAKSWYFALLDICKENTSEGQAQIFITDSPRGCWNAYWPRFREAFRV